MQTQSVMNKKGFTLVEMAVTLVVLGIVMVLAFKLVPKYTEQSSKEASQSQYERIDRAIEGFVFANQRLPFPAGDTDGLETSGIEKGYLPYKTLGLSAAPRNEAGLPLRFAVFDEPESDANKRENDRSLTALKDRFMPYVATDEDSVDSQPTAIEPGTLLNPGESNILDFCQALNTATYEANKIWNDNGNAHWVFSPNDLKIVSATGADRYNVAYVIHDLGQGDSGGSGDLTDGQNTTATNDLAFSDPAASLDRLNDDRVYAKTFDQLWERFGCHEATSVIGHAYPNVATAAAIKNQAMADYQVQLKLGEEVAAADVIIASASLASGIASTLSAAASIPIAASEAINTAGAMSFTIGLGAMATAAAATGTVSAAISTGMAAANVVYAGLLVDAGEEFNEEINTLSADVYSNLEQADEDGLYQQ